MKNETTKYSHRASLRAGPKENNTLSRIERLIFGDLSHLTPFEYTCLVYRSHVILGRVLLGFVAAQVGGLALYLWIHGGL